MGPRKRAALFPPGLATVLALLAAAPPDAAAAPPPRKSVQDCSDELRDKASAIDKAGMSASAFFHSCWWHTEPGTPTPIVADERAKEPFRAPSRAPARTLAAMRFSRRPASDALVAARRPSRFASRRPSPARVDRDDADEVVVRARPAGGEAVFVPRAPEAGASGAAPAFPAIPAMPREISVGVPVIGKLSLPVLPVLAPTVRAVVDHQLVPGLITTEP